MPPGKIAFTLLSPEMQVMSDFVDMVVVPGEQGDFGVLPHHESLVSTLRPGLITLYHGSSKRHIFITDGFAHVMDNSCKIMADTCEFVDSLDLHEIEAMAQKIYEEVQVARTESEIQNLQRSRELLMLKIRLLKELKIQ